MLVPHEAEGNDLLARCLSGAAAEADRCPAACAWFDVHLTKLAQCIDLKVPDVAHTRAQDAHGVVLHGAAKRRRLDENYKAELVDLAMVAKQAKTPMAVARASGNLPSSTVASWIPKYMDQMRAAMMMAFRNAQSMALAFDAGRVGSPKEETLLLVACNVHKGLAGWLAPQAFAEKLGI